MRRILGIGSLLLILAGCSDVRLPEPAPEPEIVEETPEPEPKAEVSVVDIEACRAAWRAEVKAVEDGVLDDATLRATGTACPNLEVWEKIRDEVDYGSKSPNLATAICALEEAARICGDN